jgi:hypothetical protein
MVFASSAARTSAIASPQEGMFSYLKDTNATEYYSGSAWVAIGGGGLSSPLTTKGDVWGYSTTDARVPVGTNGQVLTADSAQALGIKWASASSGALTKITSNLAFSGSTSVSVNNCFTSTYTDYLIIFSNVASTISNTAFEMRFRAGGSDNSNSNYSYGNQPVNYAAGGTSSEFSTGGSLVRILGNIINGTNKGSLFFYVNNPQATAITTWQGSGNNDDATYRVGGQFTATTSFDGFSIFPGNGAANISGNLTVYGYEK